MSNRLNFSKVYKKSSNREVREETNDYSHIRRGAIFSAVAGITYGFSKLSNTMAVGRWGHTLFAWSTAGMVYLGADAVLSAAEIGVNKTKYFRKVRRVSRFLKTIKKEDVNLYSSDPSEKAEAKKILDKNISGGAYLPTRGPVFKTEYPKILRQIYNDFEEDSKFDTIREVLQEKGLMPSDITKIKNDIKKTGSVKTSTVESITSKYKNSIAKVLEIVACDDFADRIIDINKNYVGKFRSPSHLKGCLTLTSDQQNKKKIKLTDEQNYVRKGGRRIGLPIMNKKSFIAWLKKNNQLVENGDFKSLESRQNDMMNLLTNVKNPRERKSINARLQKRLGFGFNGLFYRHALRKAAKQTEEYRVLNWKRNVFPLTKAFGAPLKWAINKCKDKAYYKGDLYKAHKVVVKLENKTKLKHADVYCENGVGFRKIRKSYRKAGVSDFIVDYNNSHVEQIPNSFVCGYFRDIKLNGTEDYFKRTKDAAINACKEIETNPVYSKTVTGKNGKDYVATAYLDYPVVITVNGQNFEGKQLPLATINVDHRHVLNSTVCGLLFDLSNDPAFQGKVNNITFTSGSKTRVIYPEQIKQDIHSVEIAGSELFETHTHCGRLLENITKDEFFVRAYKEGKFVERTASSDDESLIPSRDVIYLPGRTLDDEITKKPYEKPTAKKHYVKPDVSKSNEPDEEEKKTPPAPPAKKAPKKKAPKTNVDELEMLLLKRDILRLKKSQNQKIDFAEKQMELKKEELEDREKTIKHTAEANIVLNQDKLDYMGKDLYKSEKEDIRLEIKEKQKLIKEAQKRIEDLNKTLSVKVSKIQTQISETDAVIKEAEEILKNKKIESVAEIRAKIRVQLAGISKVYNAEIKPELKSTFNRLTGERRKDYSEVVKERSQENAKIAAELKETREKIKEEEEKRGIKKQNNFKFSNPNT